MRGDVLPWGRGCIHIPYSLYFYPVTKSNAKSSLLTSRSGLNGFPRGGLFVSFALPLPLPLPPLPAFEWSCRFGDSGPLVVASGCDVSPAILDRRRGRSGIVVVVVVVVVITLGAIPDITDESSAGMPPPGTNAVAAAVAATVADDDEVGPRDDPSQNGEP